MLLNPGVKVCLVSTHGCLVCATKVAHWPVKSSSKIAQRAAKFCTELYVYGVLCHSGQIVLMGVDINPQNPPQLKGSPIPHCKK